MVISRVILKFYFIGIKGLKWFLFDAVRIIIFKHSETFSWSSGEAVDMDKP